MLVKLLSAAAVLAAAPNAAMAANLRAGNGQQGGAPAATQLANEVTHDLEMNYNKIAPFGKCFDQLTLSFYVIDKFDFGGHFTAW